MMSFSEVFLHHVWQFRLFNQQNLCTENQLQLKIIHTGIYHHDSGPDFQSAKILIGDTLWAGNIEIHLKSSDWLKHLHHHDDAYENVILHVVYEHDFDVERKNGTKIPVLELKDKIAPETIQKYEGLRQSLSHIPCENQIGRIDEFLVNQWLSRVILERLEHKMTMVNDLLKELKGNWEETFYVLIAKSFGFKNNALPFEMLARSLPQQYFAKHKNQQLQVEALIFGQAGFLDGNLKDEYPLSLQHEFRYLKNKYRLQPIDNYLWKFLRLRPNNFPTIRLAQFAALINRSHHLFSKVIASRSVDDIKAIFADLKAGIYWNNHYRFDVETDLKEEKHLGENAAESIILNAIVPLLFTYGKTTANTRFINYSLTLLENLKPEKNAVIEIFAKSGVKIKTAAQSQSLLQLKKTYCDEKKCLNCGIGIQILKPVKT